MNIDDLKVVIEGVNLSDAWAKAMITCYDKNGSILSPAVIRFPTTALGGIETPEIRKIADNKLMVPGKTIPGQSSIETVAGTIFPQSIWRISKGNRELFYKSYLNMFPGIKIHKLNKRGTYFQRMIGFENGKEPVNQLEHVISTWHSGNHRHSALQAAIFDPRVDHSDSRRLGFPCLQQVAFHPQGANGKDGLSIVGFYANQTLVEKAYGNYLGLYRLGLFMAGEMNLTLKEVVCVASVLKLNNTLNKKSCDAEIKAIKAVVNDGAE